MLFAYLFICTILSSYLISNLENFFLCIRYGYKNLAFHIKHQKLFFSYYLNFNLFEKFLIIFFLYETLIVYIFFKVKVT